MEQNGIKYDYKDEDIELITNIGSLSFLSEANPSTYALVLCREGVLEFSFNGTPIHLGQDMSFVCPPNSRITNIMLSPDIHIAILRISTRMIHKMLHSGIEQWNRYFYVNKYNVTEATAEHKRQMRFYQDLIESKAQTQSLPEPYRKEIMQSLIRATIFEILSLIKQSEDSGAEQREMSRSNFHFNKFLSLLSATPVKNKPVQYYSDQLCISAKYLSIVCKKCSNKSARQWINDMKDEDIRYNLVNTGLSIKEIALKLGFEDFSFFCKYVRRRFGFSPTELRRKSELKYYENEDFVDDMDENP